ncbi:MAG: hybrid sensor histidine kinase/response regulator [Bacteroidetes bacterium]|nr:hybrid sensor histidine kinase/response regulator [Bacteroidota bacterium]
MKQTIMLVDDDETFLGIASPILEANEFEVRAISDAQQAVTILREFTPDLIISDIEMPGITGIDLLRKVQSQQETQNVPFIFLTANGDLDTVALGKELGSDDYLTKPVNYKLLVATVKGKLKKQTILQRSQNHQIETIKNQLLRIFSHEMRTPLTSIIGATEMLSDPDANFSAAEMTVFLEMLQNNSQRLTSMFDDYLLVTRIESGEILSDFYTTPCSFRPHELIENVLLHHFKSAAQRRVTVVNNAVHDEVTCPVLLSHIEIMLCKLIDNAIKFSEMNSSVVIEAVQGGGMIRFSVTDSGCGIPPEAYPSLFDKFFQVNRESQEQQGSGLGLYIVKKLTERYGGNIRFESEVNRGTTFHVDLPVVLSK